MSASTSVESTVSVDSITGDQSIFQVLNQSSNQIFHEVEKVVKATENDLVNVNAAQVNQVFLKLIKEISNDKNFDENENFANVTNSADIDFLQNSCYSREQTINTDEEFCFKNDAVAVTRIKNGSQKFNLLQQKEIVKQSKICWHKSFNKRDKKLWRNLKLLRNEQNLLDSFKKVSQVITETMPKTKSDTTTSLKLATAVQYERKRPIGYSTETSDTEKDGSPRKINKKQKTADLNAARRYFTNPLVNTDQDAKKHSCVDDYIEINDSLLTYELNKEYDKITQAENFLNSPNRIITEGSVSLQNDNINFEDFEQSILQNSGHKELSVEKKTSSMNRQHFKDVTTCYSSIGNISTNIATSVDSNIKPLAYETFNNKNDNCKKQNSGMFCNITKESKMQSPNSSNSDVLKSCHTFTFLQLNMHDFWDSKSEDYTLYKNTEESEVPDGVLYNLVQRKLNTYSYRSPRSASNENLNSTHLMLSSETDGINKENLSALTQLNICNTFEISKLSRKYSTCIHEEQIPKSYPDTIIKNSGSNVSSVTDKLSKPCSAKIKSQELVNCIENLSNMILTTTKPQVCDAEVTEEEQKNKTFDLKVATSKKNKNITNVSAIVSPNRTALIDHTATCRQTSFGDIDLLDNQKLVTKAEQFIQHFNKTGKLSHTINHQELSTNEDISGISNDSKNSCLDLVKEDVPENLTSICFNISQSVNSMDRISISSTDRDRSIEILPDKEETIYRQTDDLLSLDTSSIFDDSIISINNTDLCDTDICGLKIVPPNVDENTTTNIPNDNESKSFSTSNRIEKHENALKMLNEPYGDINKAPMKNLNQISDTKIVCDKTDVSVDFKTSDVSNTFCSDDKVSINLNDSKTVCKNLMEGTTCTIVESFVNPTEITPEEHENGFEETPTCSKNKQINVKSGSNYNKPTFNFNETIKSINVQNDQLPSVLCKENEDDKFSVVPYKNHTNLKQNISENSNIENVPLAQNLLSEATNTPIRNLKLNLSSVPMDVERNVYSDLSECLHTKTSDVFSKPNIPLDTPIALEQNLPKVDDDCQLTKNSKIIPEPSPTSLKENISLKAKHLKNSEVQSLQASVYNRPEQNFQQEEKIKPLLVIRKSLSTKNETDITQNQSKNIVEMVKKPEVNIIKNKLELPYVSSEIGARLIDSTSPNFNDKINLDDNQGDMTLDYNTFVVISSTDENFTITSGEYEKSLKESSSSNVLPNNCDKEVKVCDITPIATVKSEVKSNTLVPQTSTPIKISSKLNTNPSRLQSKVNDKPSTSQIKKNSSSTFKAGIKRPASDFNRDKQTNKRYKPDLNRPSTSASTVNENQMGTDPRWDLYNFSKPEDCFKAVHSQWCYTSLPNPHEDRTCRFYEKPVPCQSNFTIPGNNVRLSTECVSIYENQIDQADQEIQSLTHDLDSYGALWDRRKIGQTMERINKLRSIYNRLVQAYNEAYHFYKYYEDLATGWNARYITNYKKNEIQHQLNMIENYDSFYGHC